MTEKLPEKKKEGAAEEVEQLLPDENEIQLKPLPEGELEEIQRRDQEMVAAEIPKLKQEIEAAYGAQSGEAPGAVTEVKQQEGKEAKTTPLSESEQSQQEFYAKLSPEDRASADRTIATLRAELLRQQKAFEEQNKKEAEEAPKSYDELVREVQKETLAALQEANKLQGEEHLAAIEKIQRDRTKRFQEIDKFKKQ